MNSKTLRAGLYTDKFQMLGTSIEPEKYGAGAGFSQRGGGAEVSLLPQITSPVTSFLLKLRLTSKVM
jgi:hypothetical protein